MSVLIKKIFSLVTVIIISTTLYAQIEGNEIIEKEFKVKDEGFAQAWKSVKTADKIFLMPIPPYFYFKDKGG